MNPLPSDAGRPPLEVRGVRASSVIVQRIPPEKAEVFMQWQRGISAAAAEAPGYQTTEVYPPSSGQQEWVVVIHFDDAKRLQDWLDSPRRAEWVAKLPSEIHDFRLKTLPSGFASWFVGLGPDVAPAPHWKLFLAVLFMLYPMVMLITLFLSPYTIPRFGLAGALLIGNVISVALLEWFGGAAITGLLGPWLRAKGKEGRALSLAGLVLIVLALGAMAFVFDRMTPRP
jgi:antibiotic biosynthesis monooxygenase (ABM) superfamily enzyme